MAEDSQLLQPIRCHHGFLIFLKIRSNKCWTAQGNNFINEVSDYHLWSPRKCIIYKTLTLKASVTHFLSACFIISVELTRYVNAHKSVKKEKQNLRKETFNEEDWQRKQEMGRLSKQVQFFDVEREKNKEEGKNKGLQIK